MQQYFFQKEMERSNPTVSVLDQIRNRKSCRRSKVIVIAFRTTRLIDQAEYLSTKIEV